MKSKRNFVLLLALGTGLLGTAATAQTSQISAGTSARIEYATFDPSQSGLLRQADWDDHRRCDGDHDRDDRGCYYRDRYGNRVYYGNNYYGNGYYATPRYAPPAGWYDRDGHWHAYDRDRDRDRRRHDDDDRR
jgi:hypothetical protein